MDIQSIIRDAGPIASALNVFVLALGYYFLVKLYRESFHERQRERMAGSRPQVVVATDYSHLHPLLFEGAPIENSKGMNDLVNAMEKIRDYAERDGRRRTATSSGEG